MKQVYKYDVNGTYLEPVMIEDNEPVPSYCTDIPLPQPNWKPVFQNGTWVETMTEDERLTPLRAAKMDELENTCNQAIINGFDYTINGISYHFSCSLAAQSNFIGVNDLIKEGVITSKGWTVVNNTTGKTERIVLDIPTFNNVKMALFQHIDSNTSKLRDDLEPKVNAATVDQLPNIVWS
jgi:hypothetical protein